MATTPTAPLSRAAHFVWLTARVLEQRLFAHHFLGGSPDPAETALTAYRNPDGGYGHALDPDLRGPLSEPLHTSLALQLLDSLGRCTGQRVQRICRYLTEVSTPDGALPAVLPDRHCYPAAPWLTPVDDAPPASGDLLVTGPVAGVLHRNDIWHAWLFRATDFCWAAVESLETTHPYEVFAALTFLDGARERARAEAAAERLGRLVREQGLAVLEPGRESAYPLPGGYAPGEHHYVTDFAQRPRSLAHRWFSDEELERGLDHLQAQQREDGGWPVNWRAWAPGTHLESRPAVTVRALLTLRAYGRLDGAGSAGWAR